MHVNVMAIQQGGKPPRRLFPLNFTFTREDNSWVGVCVELGTSAFSDTIDRALKELCDAVVLQLEEAERLFKLDAYLEERKVKPYFVDSKAEGDEIINSKTWSLNLAGV
jgi:hypothetical protein